jgi:hypothetical protein
VWVVIPTAAGIRRRDDAARRRNGKERETRARIYARVRFKSERVGGDRSGRVIEHADTQTRRERERERASVAWVRRNQARGYLYVSRPRETTYATLRENEKWVVK